MPTLQAAMLESGSALGTLVEGTTTSLGTTSSFISSPFANAALYTSTTFDEQYALILSGNNAGQQRALEAGGLDATTGEFSTSDPVFTNAVAAGVDFWLSARLPALKFGQFEGVRECVNRAHRRINVRRRIALPGVSQQQKYPLDISTYWWWREDSILEILDPQSNALAPLAPTRHRWHFVENGDTPSIEFPNGAPWNTGETGYLWVQCPANSYLRKDATASATVSGGGAVTAITVVTGGYYTSTPTVTITGGGGSGATATATVTNNAVVSIAVGAAGSGYTSAPVVTLTAGVWANQTSQTAGLQALSDESLANLTQLIVVTKAYCYRELAKWGNGTEADDWKREAAKWTAWARRQPDFIRQQQPRSAGIPDLRPSYSGRRY